MKCPILKTLIYFNLFDWPLRAEEVWKWLYNPYHKCNPTINDILKTASCEDGFYFLKNAGNKNFCSLIKTRLLRYRFAEKKYKRALWFVKIARFFPFIKMVAICNDLGYSNAPQKSDIDLFIITSRKKIWTARFFITGFLKIFKLRPGETKNNAICPSFFVDEDNLNLEKLTLKNKQGEIDDPHFVYWINQMTPIWNRNQTYEKFRQANQWVKKFLPNIYDYKVSNRRNKTLSRSCGRIFEKLFSDYFENLAKKIQLKILPKDIKMRANQNTNIVITDGILKFHIKDTRAEIRDKFYEKINRI